MSGPIRELFHHRGLLWSMTARDFRSKYAGSLMGVFWTVINPLLLLGVFSFIGITVIKVRFGSRAGIDALYIFCGIVPWLAFQDGLARSTTVLLENKNLLTRARFPAAVLPAYPAVTALLGQMAGLAILVGAAAWVTAGPGLSLIWAPVLLVAQLLFTIGLCWLLAATSVFLRDVGHVLPVLLLVWMFGTPIFYRADALPPLFQTLIGFNPLALLIGSLRRVILEGGWPTGQELLILALYAVVTPIVGAALFGRLQRGFADRL